MAKGTRKQTESKRKNLFFFEQQIGGRAPLVQKTGLYK